MFYFLDTSSQIKRNSKSVAIFQNVERSMNEKSSTLRDITDGLLYKKILRSKIGDLIKRKKAFSECFFVNTIQTYTKYLWYLSQRKLYIEHVTLI